MKPKTRPTGRLLYAQSGGVTAVINATAAGVIEAARAQGVQVYAARNGILGALREELIDTSKESKAAAGRRLWFLSLQAQVARSQPRRVRAADRRIPRPRHPLVSLQRRQ
jgi:6-phosphofructokinase